MGKITGCDGQILGLPRCDWLSFAILPDCSVGQSGAKLVLIGRFYERNGSIAFSPRSEPSV